MSGRFYTKEAELPDSQAVGGLTTGAKMALMSLRELLATRMHRAEAYRYREIALENTDTESANTLPSRIVMRSRRPLTAIAIVGLGMLLAATTFFALLRRVGSDSLLAISSDTLAEQHRTTSGSSGLGSSVAYADATFTTELLPSPYEAYRFSILHANVMEEQTHGSKFLEILAFIERTSRPHLA